MYRLRAGETSSVYSPGQIVSAAYAAKYPRKVAKVRRRRKVAPPPPPPKEPKEWEVTAVWKTRKGRRMQTSDVTFRVTLVGKLAATPDSIKKAVWAAVVHGRQLESYQIEGINWRIQEAGRDRAYDYWPGQVMPPWEETVKATRKVVRGTGLERLRVAPVED